MTLISEDPTLLVGLCLLAAVGCFVALRATQDGKYLIWGSSILGAALVALVVERVWITDNERIETVVYDLQRALRASDADAILSHLTPEVQLVQDEGSLSALATRALIRATLANSQFEIVRVRNLQTSAGRLTRRGKADFRAFIQGESQGPMGLGMAGATDTAWSLGFVETEPGVWKVDRITPVSLPNGVSALARPWGRTSAEAALSAPGRPGNHHRKGRSSHRGLHHHPPEAPPPSE